MADGYHNTASAVAAEVTTPRVSNTITVPVATRAPSLTVVQSVDETTVTPGQAIHYHLLITNTGNVADSFGLSAGSHAWATTFAPAVANLPPSSSATVAVTVTIPPGASTLASDAVTLTATSQGEGTKKDAAILTTTVRVVLVRGVTLSPNAALAGTAGANVVYTLTVTNVGANTAVGVQVADTLPAGFAWTVTGGSGVTCPAGPQTGSFTCTVASMVPVTSPTATITVSRTVTDRDNKTVYQVTDTPDSTVATLTGTVNGLIPVSSTTLTLPTLYSV